MVDLNVKVESDWGQGFKKLLEMIRLGLGKLTEAHLIRAKAEADADRITSISEAMRLVNPRADLQLEYADGPIKISAKQDLAVPLPESTNLIERSAERSKHIEVKRQINTERILAGAAYDLKDTNEISDIPPDEDWVSRFFSYAQDISNPDIQILWSKLLSGKIKRPDAFSLRTLDCIRNLTIKEAEVFIKAAKLAIMSNANFFFIFRDDNLGRNIAKTNRLFPAERFLLGELGLLYPSNDLIIECFRDLGKDELFWGSDYVIHIKRGAINSKVELPIWKFTETGNDLINLVEERPLDQDYVDWIGDFFASKNGCAILGHIHDRDAHNSCHYKPIKRYQNFPFKE